MRQEFGKLVKEAVDGNISEAEFRRGVMIALSEVLDALDNLATDIDRLKRYQ